MKKTIVMLSAKRCGSTAVFRMFQKHPDVNVCHVNQDIDNWEPNFWNLAAKGIEGNKDEFIKRFSDSHPFLDIPEIFTEESVFEMWDQILDRLGPIIFDKTPNYLGDEKAIDLLYKYKERGNDVRIFAVIRDPRDVITSQYELWNNVVNDDSPKKREDNWLKKYGHLERLRSQSKTIPLFKYEHFASTPVCYAAMMFYFCGLEDCPQSYSHIKPTSVNRYKASISPAIRKWKMSSAFKEHLEKYGYNFDSKGFTKRYYLPIVFNSLLRRIRTSLK